LSVRFLAFAREDLIALYDYVAEVASPATAIAYIERIEQACLGLADFPDRGAPRGQFGQGIRILGFERRATIVFRVTDGEVQIVRVLYGGRDADAAFRGEP